MNCTNDPKMDESILEECRKIFEESTPIEKIDWNHTKTIVQNDNEDTSKNKRNSSFKHSEPPQKKKYMITPAHIMAKRLQSIKSSSVNPTSLKEAEKKVKEKMTNKTGSIWLRTASQTVTKGTKRICHVPDSCLMEIPMVLEAKKSKLAVNVRTKYFHMIVKECYKLYKSREDAIQRALEEEFNCYTRCKILNTYRNSAMLLIGRLRKETNSDHPPKNPTNYNDHELNFIGGNFYNNIKKWVLTRKELEENGFPLPGALQKGFALFRDGKTYEPLPEDTKKCARCKKIYKVLNGESILNEDCIYHAMDRFTYQGETKYACCKQTVPSIGCCLATNHVYNKGDLSKVGGFVQTFQPDEENDPKSHEVYALDCEMVYTTNGIELARVTIVNNDCKTIYESLVRPFGKILDYNTRFSGLTETIMSNVTNSITDVQAVLLHLFNSNTILIGHSLESDLKALKIIHGTIIDTSVLFPHKMGPPKKQALRTLSFNILNKIIQNSEFGHDSAEDAITCMELIKWRLREELKTR